MWVNKTTKVDVGDGTFKSIREALCNIELPDNATIVGIERGDAVWIDKTDSVVYYGATIEFGWKVEEDFTPTK